MAPRGADRQLLEDLVKGEIMDETGLAFAGGRRNVSVRVRSWSACSVVGCEYAGEQVTALADPGFFASAFLNRTSGRAGWRRGRVRQ